MEDSGYKSATREQLGTKRSFDQITTSGELTSSESPVKMSRSSMNGPAQPSPEKLPGVISTHNGPSENTIGHLNLLSGQVEKSAEKSDVELSNERPLMNMQQEVVGPSNTILLLQNPLQHSPQMGGIPFIVFPTAGGIPAAPVPTGGNNAFNTVPAQQSLETPILPASNSPGSQIAPRASTFSPQLQSLHISSASSQKSKNIVTSEASILGSSEAITTVDTTEISQQLSLTGPEGDRTDLEGGQQETGNFKSPVQNKEVPKQQLLQPLSLEDSGFGKYEKSEENTLQDKHLATAGAATRGDTYSESVMLLKKEDLAQGNGKILLQTTIEMARMRKTGQYKGQVQFSKSMSEDAVRKTIQETFPAFDLSGRFSCASTSNMDSALQFHGPPRVWDGKTIRRILNGKSTLYIVMEEIQIVVPLTMEPTSVDSNVESAVISPYSVKRTRRDTKVATGKSVVVLRTRDVRVRNDFVFMPNTIEMAQLKKQSRGQFKRNVQISSQMTETDVKHTLMEHFPILEGKRFYCASVVEKRTRLEFHGKRRIWDGRFIKKVIKGNSALYVFVEEVWEQGLQDIKAPVIDMKPKTSHLKGGDPFLVSFRPCVDANVKSLHAEFFKSGVIFSNVELAITPLGVFGNSIPGAPSSGWANVILKDGNGTLVGSTEIFFFPNVMEAVLMAQTPSPIKNVSTEMRCHTASSFNSGDEDPQIYRALQDQSRLQLLGDLNNDVAIKPKESHLEGGYPFLVSFRPCVDANVKSVHAEFSMSGVIFSNVELAITPLGLFGNSIPGAPSSGWANVILKDGNGTRLGSTGIYYFRDMVEAVAMV